MPDFEDVHVRIQRHRSVNNRWNGSEAGLVPCLPFELGPIARVVAHNVLKSWPKLGKRGENAGLDQTIEGRLFAPQGHGGICDDQWNDRSGRTSFMETREIERVIVNLPNGRCG